jgi:hypothetical protein
MSSQRQSDQSEPETPSSMDGTRRGRRVPRDRALLETLRMAEISDCQLVPWGSNYTFAVALERPNASPVIGIYKPGSGEIPLWDFQSGTLYRREYASYLLSRVLGWNFIPPTVIRGGPHGVGTLQAYIEPAKGTPQRTLRTTFEEDLKRMFMFDLLTNNADRKSSHFFVGAKDGRLWGIDHGLTFHVHPKLRTVIWDFCGDPISADLRAGLLALVRHASMIRRLLQPFLAQEEIESLLKRAATLQRQEVFPVLSERRNIPYGW